MIAGMDRDKAVVRNLRNRSAGAAGLFVVRAIAGTVAGVDNA